MGSERSDLWLSLNMMIDPTSTWIFGTWENSQTEKFGPAGLCKSVGSLGLHAGSPARHHPVGITHQSWLSMTIYTMNTRPPKSLKWPLKSAEVIIFGCQGFFWPCLVHPRTPDSLWTPYGTIEKWAIFEVQIKHKLDTIFRPKLGNFWRPQFWT